MVRLQRAQLVRAFTPPAAAQLGVQVFVFVGTNAHKSLRLKETDLIRKAGLPFPRAAGFKWRSGVCALRPAAALTTKINASCRPPSHFYGMGSRRIHVARSCR